MKVQVFDGETSDWKTVVETEDIRLVMGNDDYTFHLTEAGDRNVRVVLQSRPTASIASLSQASNHIILLPIRNPE